MLVTFSGHGADVADVGDSGGTRIFLSYARVDQPRVAKLAAALEARCIALWWDRALEGGAAFADVIEAELKRADACIVAWSKASAGSHWVRDEAGWARDHGRLVPVLLDRAEPPLGFRQFQAIDLSHWNGRADAPEMDALLAALGRATPARPGVGKRRVLPRAVLAGVAALLVAGLGFFGWRQAAAPDVAPSISVARPAAAAVAVLPFADLSAARDQAYFADGVAEEITMRLARDGRLKVIGRATAAAIRDRASDLGYVRGQLGVGHLLEGSVREAGGRLRIAVRLIDTKDGGERWSETYDRQAGDIFAVQDEVAAAVVERLALNLAAPAAGTAAQAINHSTSPENYRKYLLGRSLMRERTAPALERAAGLFAEVMRDDPAFAPAIAGFAFAQLVRPSYGGLSYAESTRSAAPAVGRALALDPGLAEAWLGSSILHIRSGDPDASVEAARRAIALDPANPEIIGPASVTISNSTGPGGLRESLRLLERAVAIDALYIQAQHNLQNSYGETGDVAAARAALARFERAAVRPEQVARLRLVHAANFDRPVDIVRIYRASRRLQDVADDSTNFFYLWSLAALYDRSGLLAAPEARSQTAYWTAHQRGDWPAAAAAFEGGEEGELPAMARIWHASRIYPEAGRDAALVRFVEARHSPPAIAEVDADADGLQVLLNIGDAYSRTGNAPTARRYRDAARSQLAAMRAAGWAESVLLPAPSQLALADGDRARALRLLSASAAEPTVKANICYGPVWPGTSPTWEGLRAEPGFKRLVETCRALVNRQRAAIGLPPADLP